MKRRLEAAFRTVGFMRRKRMLRRTPAGRRQIRSGVEGRLREQRDGVLPSFIIVGAQKAGTTSVKANLRQHPMIYMPQKEVHFFDRHWDRGIDWYRGQFAHGVGKLCGEKTPRYMTRRVFMERLHAVAPDAKIIILLRDPVARLFSHINHYVQRGFLPEPDKIDVDYLEKEIRGVPSRFRNYVGRGFYADQITNNVLTFFSLERLFIRHTDPWARSVDRSTLRVAGDPLRLRGSERGTFTQQLHFDLQDFLGVERWDPPALRVSHVRRYRAEVTPEAREWAAAFYRAPNKRLFDLLGYEIPEWLADS